MPVKSVESVPAEPVSVGEGVFRQVLIGPEEGPHFAMRRFTIEPGGYLPKHTNEVEHEQYVLRGRAQIGIGDEVYEVGPGDVVFIPAGVPHWYRCVGEEPFEFICVVPNRPDRMTLLEEAEAQTGC